MFTKYYIFSIGALIASYLYTYAGIPTDQHLKVSGIGMFFVVCTFLLLTTRHKLDGLIVGHALNKKSIPDHITAELTTFSKSYNIVAILCIAICTSVTVYLRENYNIVSPSNVFLLVSLSLPVIIYVWFHFMSGLSMAFGFQSPVNTTEAVLSTKIDYLLENTNTTPKMVVDKIDDLNRQMQHLLHVTMLVVDEDKTPTEAQKYIHKFGIDLAVDFDNFYEEVKEILNGIK